jgi:hypothetical protein
LRIAFARERTLSFLLHKPDPLAKVTGINSKIAGNRRNVTAFSSQPDGVPFEFLGVRLLSVTLICHETARFLEL